MSKSRLPTYTILLSQQKRRFRNLTIGFCIGALPSTLPYTYAMFKGTAITTNYIVLGINAVIFLALVGWHFYKLHRINHTF